MGFKCPLCLKDFKRNKKAWVKHCKEEHKGIGKDIVKAVKIITKEIKE